MALGAAKTLVDKPPVAPGEDTGGQATGGTRRIESSIGHRISHMEHDSHFRTSVVRRLQQLRTSLRTLLVLNGASRLVVFCLLFT
ncbi:MAG: hypothetical protein IID37_16525, partial [Planctomycetes bacterium]|nr:hypothetical protein [Planctomycetota bacterium]